ncbi:hypothetical protein FO499_27150 [Bacillus anthracis]|uniref:phospholipase D family protein n=1 Tax=Bacillus TaxID=1386 RepID=UPI0008FDF653|nr:MULTISPECIES: phospholipase D family protein [Bacillus]MBL3852431.1 phospholipase D family protein [Bacillus cereus]MDR4410061.1 hypothetical protein [Bacillus anthracis]OJE21771.1 hypothetical protein BAQ46_20755 [Bacillus paranthracis]TSI15286.1 hypothetical protein FOT98_12845 [Bacillus sp. HY001]
MSTYFWRQHTFWDDIEYEVVKNKPKKIVISSAYLSPTGIEYLRELCKEINLKRDDIIVYCSIDFNDTKPADILEVMCSFSKAFLVVDPFLHSKIYEFHCEDNVVFYHGSANLTEGGISRNFECMSKDVLEHSPICDFWEHLSVNCIEVTEEVIALYQSHQKTLPSKIQKNNETLQRDLENIKEKQYKMKTYPDLSGFYFDVDDYITVSKEWYKASNSASIKRRKVIQDKLLALHKEIEPMVKKWDLHPHYHKDYIASGIIPSVFNHWRVGAIWVRYGKHKGELNPYGSVVRKNRRGNKDPIEQFHKHACFQISFVSNGIDLGMFHGTAHDGIDRYHVREKWNEIKDDISGNYNSLVGNKLIWHFYDAKNDTSKYRFEIDKGTPNEFLDFYNKYDEDGLESFCMCHFELDDERIKTRGSILKEAMKLYEVLMPLYKAMTFRIPSSMR